MGDIITEPGIYNMPAEDYHADPVPEGSLSASGARKLLPPSSPATYKYERDHPQPSTKAMELGTAAHMRILGEGPTIRTIHADKWNTDKIKAEVAAARAAGEIPLKRDATQKIMDMAAKLREHKTAQMLLQPESGRAEQSIFWQDPTYGIWRRARPDWLPYGNNGLIILSDYKTHGRSIHRDVFAKTIVDHGYPIAAAQYCDAVEAMNPGIETWFVWIVQETTPPYQVACYWAKGGPGTPEEPGADPDIIQYGQTQMQRAMEIYRDCQAANRWPGHQPLENIETIHLPRWTNRSVDND
jgi:PDDEXK-like domain of unknown function (DUF3799)